jgi:hypothetical protein
MSADMFLDLPTPCWRRVARSAERVQPAAQVERAGLCLRAASAAHSRVYSKGLSLRNREIETETLILASISQRYFPRSGEACLR